MSRDEILKIIGHIRCEIFGKEIKIAVLLDKKYGKRTYIQAFYWDQCKDTKEMKEWRGVKFYISDHMIEDEIVKRCYAAFEAAVKHEVMEGFTFDNIVVFNPHVNFRELIKISHMEVTRPPQNFDV
jgi:hypothetical protein